MLTAVDDARVLADDGHAAWSESFNELFAVSHDNARRRRYHGKADSGADLAAAVPAWPAIKTLSISGLRPSTPGGCAPVRSEPSVGVMPQTCVVAPDN
jgi:hypothetical protein